jgi:hypothetical protein
MSVLAIQIEPGRRIRVLFDCRIATVDPMDQRRIEQAIERSIALARADDETSELLLSASKAKSADLVGA